MAEFYLPPELQQIIFKELMYSCARGLEFRSQIQDAWFKVNLKRLERAIKTGSQATYLTALKQLFLDMDGLVLLPSERREKYYRDIARSHFIYKHRINKAKLWVVGFHNLSLRDAWAMTSLMVKEQSNLLFFGNISERCYNVLFGYLLLKDECTQDQVKLILCGWNHPHLHLLEADGFWGRSREEYIKSLPGHKVTLGNQELLEDELITPKVNLKFPSKFSDYMLG